MTPHKYADLLRYAADNADALFVSRTYNERYGDGIKDLMREINIVLTHLYLDDWQIYKEPVTETVWYWRDLEGNLNKHEASEVEMNPRSLRWFMKITYVDGKPTKVEFSDENKPKKN